MNEDLAVGRGNNGEIIIGRPITASGLVYPLFGFPDIDSFQAFVNNCQRYIDEYTIPQVWLDWEKEENDATDSSRG